MTKVDRLLLCSCEGSMAIDPATAARAAGAGDVRSCTALCTRDIGIAESALKLDGVTMIACGQQAATFESLAEELSAPGALRSVDIRDRAGWTADGAAHAKQAALLADAALDRPATPTKDVTSDGVCMILGTGEAALEAARRLADRLAVTCLLESAPADLIPDASFDIALGRVKIAGGALGKFAITVDGFAELIPGGRGGATFAARRDGAKSACDIILDLRGAPALFPAAHKRDGYLRADPRDPAAVERAIAEAAELEGAFEKPLYIRYDATICAHSRARQPGCDRCLNVCPTGAITADGDHVRIDADICAGCGACAAVCPSGAASYEDPAPAFLFARMRAMATAYRAAGGTAPRLLVHDGEHGAEMIRLSARFGRGLPADVIPLDVHDVEGFGHAEMLAALALGFGDVAVLTGPRTDMNAPEGQAALARAITAGTGQDAGRIALIAPADPEALEAMLYGVGHPALTIDTILPLGGRREVTRLAASALAGADVGGGDLAAIPLPAGAPYGAVVVDTEACTLCLACVSLCPVGALGDNPDRPQLRFQETACLQCGICEATCPENAITLVPQLDLRNPALSHQVLHEEEPYECIVCSKPFGVKSTIEKIVSKLEGKHWMFKGSDNARLIRMCDDCRIRAQYHQEDSPFRSADRPRVRTTDDYLAERDKKPS